MGREAAQAETTADSGRAHFSTQAAQPQLCPSANRAGGTQSPCVTLTARAGYVTGLGSPWHGRRWALVSPHPTAPFLTPGQQGSSLLSFGCTHLRHVAQASFKLLPRPMAVSGRSRASASMPHSPASALALSRSLISILGTFSREDLGFGNKDSQAT